VTVASDLARRTFRKARERVPYVSGNYPYVVARLKAKKALLFPKEMYAKMLQMEVPAIARVLGEGEYRQEILALGARHSGVALIEKATRANLARVFPQILDFSEGDLKTMIARYLDRWDIANIKTAVRGKLFGASPEEIHDGMVPAGSFTDEFLRAMADAEDLGALGALLGDTIFWPAWRAGAGDNEFHLAGFEDALDWIFYKDFLDSIPGTTEPMKLFRNFVRREIDVVNLRTLLRLRGMSGKVQREVFLPGGYELSRERLRELAGLDLANTMNQLREYDFYPALSVHMEEVEQGKLSRALREVEKWHLREAARWSNLYPLTIVPILDYILAKSREVENIRIIARGKADGLSPEAIRELLVV
jgi:V/A-type H+-transporting ATPase subunit C